MPKISLKLAYKKQLISKVYFLVFQTESKIETISGQFFSLEVAPKTFRSYSTVYTGQKPPHFFEETQSLPILLGDSSYVCFMISTKPGGLASEYFEKNQIGDELTAIGPNGKFKLVENQNPKVFIATGTGLAPFVAIISDVFEKDKNAKVKLFFGVWTKNDSFVKEFFKTYPKTDYPNLEIYNVIDNSEGAQLDEYNISGRVTTAIPEVVKDYKATDFYLCGHPMMVSDMAKVLEDLGAKENIYLEKFGK